MSGRINPKLRNNDARICANCKHWHPCDATEKWGNCEVALNSGLFMNHPKGRTPYLCHHSNNRYRSQKGCKTRFIRRDCDVCDNSDVYPERDEDFGQICGHDIWMQI